jgi:hypothetical protein
LTEAGLEDMLGEGIFDLASSLKNFASWSQSDVKNYE